MNLAAAPIFNKYGYPHLAVTANSNRSPELVKRWPNLTFWLGLPSEIIDGLVTTLDTLRKDGKIGNKVAMAAVGDQFGIEQSTAAREGFKKAGFELVYDKSYPFGTQDLQPIVKDAQAGNPDVFVAFSYPPDTIGLTDQAKIAGFSPKVFFIGVGTAFPLFKQKFGASAEGVMGIGGSNADLPGLKKYIEHHKAISAASRTAGRARSPTRACRCCSRRSRRSAARQREGHQRDQHRHVRHDHRQDQAPGQPLQGRLGGRPMAGRQLLRHRAEAGRRARPDRAEAGVAVGSA